MCVCVCVCVCVRARVVLRLKQRVDLCLGAPAVTRMTIHMIAYILRRDVTRPYTTQLILNGAMLCVKRHMQIFI